MAAASYICDKKFVREGDDNYQSTLKLSYENSISPLCMCKTDNQGSGVKCYIARLSAENSASGEDFYIVKKLPETGHSHSPSCLHFQMPESLSGKVALSDSTIQEDIDTGYTTIKTSVPFASKRSVNSSNNEKSNNSSSSQNVGLRKSQLTLLGIFHYLLDSTRLNRWSPKMSGKRHYSLVRYLIMKQASITIAKRGQLSDRLFIPPSYSAEKSLQNDNDMQSFIDSLKSNKTESPVGIIIGQYKSFGQKFNSATILLKHVNFDFNINIGPQDVVKRLQNKYCDYFDVAEIYQYPIFVITSVINRAGTLFATSLDFQLLTPEFLPIEPIDCQRRLIEQLVQDNRFFSVPLRFNMNKNLPLAAAVIEDSYEPLPLFFTSTPDDEIEEIDRDSKDLPEMSLELERCERKWNLPLPEYHRNKEINNE